MKSSADEKLYGQAQLFAEQIQNTLDGVFPGVHSVGARMVPGSGRAVISALNSDIASPTWSNPPRFPLYCDDEKLAEWVIQYQTVLDHSGRFLKTRKSGFFLYSIFEKEPLVRLEFDATAHTAPSSHWQFHGERGAFSHLLARAHSTKPYVTDRPHSLSSLHFPVGGRRFRPGMEDFLEFLVRECGVDTKPTWKIAVAEGREIWRRMQMRAVTRDLLVESAEVLRAHGWSVVPPADYTDDASDDTLHIW